MTTPPAERDCAEARQQDIAADRARANIFFIRSRKHAKIAIISDSSALLPAATDNQQICPDIMRSLPDTLSLMRINSLNYENLKGLSSVRVNDRYRIEFEEYVVDGQSIANNLEPFRPHRPESDEFCKISPVTACMADCLEHNAPKSPQKHRLRSAQELQATDNWMFTRKARAQVISSARHGTLCSGGSGDPPEREIPPQARKPAETASQPRRNRLTR